MEKPPEEDPEVAAIFVYVEGSVAAAAPEVVGAATTAEEAVDPEDFLAVFPPEGTREPEEGT
jgi:hypothetical protein